MSRVAIIQGKNRYDNVIQALDLIRDKIGESIKNKKNIVIKPNLCVPDNELAVTNVEGVRALLDFILGIASPQEIIIAEGPFEDTLEQSLKNYGYYEQLKDYPIKYVDLNKDNVKKITVDDGLGSSLELGIAKTVLKADFLISICPPKTHDSVITTLALKNVAVGGIISKVSILMIRKNWRTSIHGNYKKTNYIIYQLAKIYPPYLSIIDGLVGMEGNGPTSDEPVDFNLALASTDFVAIDSVCSYLMGFDPKNIGYLQFCNQDGIGESDLDKIEILGLENLKNYIKKFKPHTTYSEQLKWKEE